MSKTMDSGRSVAKRPWLLRRGGLFWTVSASVLLMMGGLAAGYLFGRNLANHPLAIATQQIQQLQHENQRLKTSVDAQSDKITSLQAKLKSVQAALDAILPAKNTYQISSNHSVSVAGGRLTIGLIGAPSEQSVTININGKQHTAVSGDVFDIASDPSITCQVKVQSFDMFKVTLFASCAPAKPIQKLDRG